MASQVEVAKLVPGAPVPLLVDGFRFAGPSCRHYFLTHAHSDHTTGLTRHFDSGVIYCSEVTAAVLAGDMGIPRTRLRPLPLDVPAEVAGVEVTPIDANHCPGAVMFLFRVPPSAPAAVPPPAVPSTAPREKPLSGAPAGGRRGTTVLHTGDLRWHDGMAAHPALRGQPVDVLMLDTTYCAPKWCFPPQDEAVAAMAELMRSEAAAHPGTLFVVGSYHIGKERAYLGAAAALGWRVWVPPPKRRLLRLLALPPAWLALLAECPEAARLHVAGMGENLHEQALAERIQGTAWGRVVAIRPTGWSYRRSGTLDRRDYGSVSIIGVPYSEHSSFPELRACVAALRPRRVIPTVNAGDAGRRRAQVDLLAGFMDLSADRSRLDSYFLPPGAGSSCKGLEKPAEGGSADGGSPGECDGAAEPAAAAAGAASQGIQGSLEPARPPAAAEEDAGPAATGALTGTLGRQQTGEAAEMAVDLTQVDVTEQHRILRAIRAEGSRQRPRPDAGTPRQQTSITRFLQGPSPPA